MISPKKKLLLLHSSNDLYGASKIFLQLIDLLTKNGFDVHIIIPEKGMLDDFLIKKDIKIEYLELVVLRKKYLSPKGFKYFFLSTPNSTYTILIFFLIKKSSSIPFSGIITYMSKPLLVNRSINCRKILLAP